MAGSNGEPHVAKGDPSKELFVHMLTKDIDLHEAILDLIDNSVDGARKSARSVDELKAYNVAVEFGPSEFSITDNCGGISLKDAEEYVFRFGRPRDAKKGKGLIGQFGVGMKRALFKMGRHFKVESKTKESHFVVEVQTERWAEQDKWDFPFTVYEKGRQEGQPGTTVRVWELYDAVAERFRQDSFANQMGRQVRAMHQHSLAAGLAVQVNGIEVTAEEPLLFSRADIRPAHIKESIQANGGVVEMDIYAGVGESDPKKAGWYVYCNGRLILQADQTNRTGWGDIGGDVSIPKIHNQFARFRGYALLESDDGDKLPWNTSKTDVEMDSPVYLQVRQRMIEMTRPVIDFLNDLDSEKEQVEQPARVAVEDASASPVALGSLPLQPVFRFERGVAKPKPVPLTSIAYRRPLKDVEWAKFKLAAMTNREVGEKTFDYYVENERDE